MAEQAAKEPTMEEILSSIRKIISEGGDEAVAPEAVDTGSKISAVSEETFDASNLTADNEQSPGESEHLLSVDELLNSDDLDFGDTEDISTDLDIEEFTPEIDIEDVAAELDVELDLEVEDTDISIDGLESFDMPKSALTPEPAPAPQPAPAAAAPVAASAALTGGAGTALEGLVSELMKPIIQEWIETNLPNIVERRVEAEINQIANKVISALRD